MNKKKTSYLKWAILQNKVYKIFFILNIKQHSLVEYRSKYAALKKGEWRVAGGFI